MFAPVAITLLLALSLACGDDGPTGSGEEEVGPEGGRVESADGDGEVIVPAGALDARRRITIRRVDPADVPPQFAAKRLAARVYRFGPDGLTFRVPVRVQIFFDADALPDGVEPEDLTIARLTAAGTIQELGDIRLIQPARGRASLQARRVGIGGQVSAFSPFAGFVDDSPGTPPTITSVSFPTTIPARPGTRTGGSVAFTDPDGDVTRLRVNELSDPNGAFDPFEFDTDVAGQTQGSIGFEIFCAGTDPCLSGPVTLSFAVEDAEGNVSTPVNLPVTFVP
ncbi:MAG: hypothetical protein ABR599_04510 [Gemmatimonadota bacterium]